MPAVLLPQLVDLALGTPEVGAVNFNVLHTLLHAMISKLGLGDVKAELSDFDREFLATISKPTKTYVPGSDKDTFPPSRVNVVTASTSDKDSAKGDDSLLDESTVSASEVNDTKIAETPSTLPDITMSSKTASTYHQLENRVAELAKALEGLNQLPTTHEFLIEVKGEMPTKKRAVNDMWQSMQVKKRVETNEEGIEKLTLMMEDLMLELERLKADNESLRNSMKNLADLDFNGLLKRLNDLEKLTEALRKDLDDGLSDLKGKFDLLPSADDFAQFVRWGDLEDALKGIRTELEKMALLAPQERIVIAASSQTEKIESRPASAVSSRPSSARSGPSAELLDILETLGNISTEHMNLEKRVTKLEEDIQNKLDKGALDNLGPTEELLNELNKLKKDIEALQREIGKLKGLSGVDEELRAQVDEILKKIGEDSDAIGRLQKMLSLLEASIDKLTNTTQDLSEDSLSKGKQIDELYGFCKDLDRKKADKEYVAMEVDVKADKKQLEGKVNHHLFDSTTAEINKTIKDILDQLAGNSDEWKNMLAKLMNDLDGKLDRMELSPLKEWLEQKLKALSKKIQDGNLQWSEDEAAGLKRQLIQHYHCLSCDKPLEIMPTGLQPALPANSGLPPSRSPRPYTTYELDQIRQHAKSFGTPEQADFYATTRQCGGSHTTTLPHQRFSRFTPTLSSLFRDEEPQDVLPLHKEEVDVMGADGHIYRGRVQRLEAKMPARLAHSASNRPSASESSRAVVRPVSARGQGTMSPVFRQQVVRTSRPQSARQKSESADAQSGITTPPPEEAVIVSEGQGAREMNVELPPNTTTMNGE